jgi:hypothetical protein
LQLGCTLVKGAQQLTKRSVKPAMVWLIESFPDRAQAAVCPERLLSSEVGQTDRRHIEPGKLAGQLNFPLHVGFGRMTRTTCVSPIPKTALLPKRNSSGVAP